MQSCGARRSLAVVPSLCDDFSLATGTKKRLAFPMTGVAPGEEFGSRLEVFVGEREESG